MISVDKAIRGFYFRVLIPVMGLMIFMIFFTLFIFQNKNIPEWMPAILLVSTIIGLPFLWLRLNVRWLLWAARNVDNITEFNFRRKIISSKKLYLAFSYEKETFEELISQGTRQSTATSSDYNDFTVSWSKPWNLFMLLFLIGMAIFFFYRSNISLNQITTSRDQLIGILMILLFLGLGVLNLVRLVSTEPVIIISREGIQTRRAGFQSWSNIEDWSLTKGKHKALNIRYKDKSLTRKNIRTQRVSLSMIDKSYDTVVYHFDKCLKEFQQKNI